MKKRNTKVISKVIAGGMLISNIPIQTFANEIENLILDASNINDKTENEIKAEIMDSNMLENENKISDENSSKDSEIIEENKPLIDETPINNKENISDRTIKEIEANKYVINTVADLKQLRTEINTNNLDTTGMIIELNSDIDFTGETSWEAIGTEQNTFKGIFDGKNHTIKNIDISNNFVGLFGTTLAPTFKNINFNNIKINSTNEQSIGLIFGSNEEGEVNVTNINFSNVSIVAENAGWIGAIAGSIPISQANISNISFDGEILSTKASVGGLIGLGSGNLSSIEIKGKIKGNYYVGGVIGLLSGPSNSVSTIEDVKINLSLESSKLTGSNSIGGIVGFAPSTVSIHNANIEGESIVGGYVGGVIGEMSGTSSSNETSISNINVNTKKLEGDNVGGIIGDYPGGDILTIEDCNIYSNIESSKFAGGIVGFITKKIIAKNNVVINEYIIGGEKAGGILSSTPYEVVLENNTIESNITALNTASGIISEIMAFSPSSVINNRFKGTIEVKSTSGKIGGLCANWNSANSNISKNEIEAEIISKVNTVGGLIGSLCTDGVTVENNVIKATISGNNQIGGLIGWSPAGKININNNSIDVVISANNVVGGLAGNLVGTTVTNNKIVSTITANDMVGGIVGETMDLKTLYSKNTAITNIIANSKVGGIMGSGYPIQTNNNFIMGNLSGNSQIGGVIGYISGTMTSPIIADTVVAIMLKGNSEIGSIVGESKNDIITQNVYYDTNLTELTDVYGIGLTTKQMQGKESEKNMNLDFENIWKLNKEYYPTFEQINTAPDIIANDKVVDNTITINQYDKFNPADYVTVEDFEGDEITISIKDITDEFDTSKYGEFSIIIMATDDKGLSSELTLTLKINPLQLNINNIPIITAEDKIITVGDKFNPLSMIVAYDKEDGIITPNIKIIKNTVNIDKVGVYEITYEVTDKDGARTTKTIKVTVKDKVISNNTTQNNNNSGTIEKDDNSNAKPQTSDEINMINIVSILTSIIGLCVINKKKKYK